MTSTWASAEALIPKPSVSQTPILRSSDLVNWTKVG